ncbi:dimethylhistidine N-methyltransferase [Iodidimonas nitroreducens]|uniref:Dimethylhistidine N-methyltransferase n=1 Tax=Iodidimonas nitroreducens TaxID=1236968 RepID=A0A5A7NC42_9PROT|nr:L-histidine N(alpha)-methyltransferase [Iodidimonas nitroreducens]GAK33383.1 histidine-specific methyltransferase EgtD [alpha proteobacterium Q-1]GER04619.1 dimethylhistidine N-methyltransferase [Iodidimonas nitroreducens]
MQKKTTQATKSPVHFIDLAPEAESFEQAALAGLKAAKKTIPAKFFYDAHGSRLFEEICKQPEYYPTRTECRLLRDHGKDIGAAVGPDALVIEFGAGALEKVRLLLDGLDNPAGFVAIDISGDHLLLAAQELASELASANPDLDITAICADYTRLDALPAPLNTSPHRKLGFFPGSTIGNFSRADAVDFLKIMHHLLGPDGMLLIGVDLKKDPAILDAAYNDAKGVTAQFNLNVLRRLNTECGANFDLDAFRHVAFYNPDRNQVEMHIESLCDQSVTVAGTRIDFKAGERIHTEISCKYSIGEFADLARSAGWAPQQVLTDDQSLFSLHILRT